MNQLGLATQSSSSIIDLIFLSNPNTLISCGTLAPLANLDPNTVQVTLNISSKKSSSKPFRKQVWMYSQADTSLVKQLLKIHHEPMPSSQECPYQISYSLD